MCGKSVAGKVGSGGKNGGKWWTMASVTATDAVKCDRNPLSRIKRKRENASGLLIGESPVPAAPPSMGGGRLVGVF